ncbi:MAG: hypothetical protein MR567_07315 [Oscillospiraceae bacterium]|nr:hypothetical protein [Oscillospiraceae bacterium]
MNDETVKMKAPDGVILNVDSACVPVFKKAGYTVVEPDAEGKPDGEEKPAEKKRKASK